MTRFDGAEYDPALDDVRLTDQLDRVRRAMASAVWLTVTEIAALTGDPENSIQAQLRHLRKKRFGSYLVLKQRRYGENSPTWEYSLGPKGAGKPQPHACHRSDELAKALAEYDPQHPLLVDH